VAVDANHAALTTMQGVGFTIKTMYALAERQNCGQECLAQIELSPEKLFVRRC
jgi:hypothetical protein